MLSNSKDRKIKLDLIHGFGSNTSQGYNNSVCFFGDETQPYSKVLFPVGKFIASRSVDRSDM